MAISPVSGINNYGQIASGKRINSAADDASGLAISNKLNSETTGLNAGSENAKAGVAALNVSEGALAQITDSLQRIYEIGVKASNSAMYSKEDLQAMQSEVSGLMDGIQDIAKGTEYNELKLLDGSMATMDLATNPDGSGMSIKMENATLSALGIEGFDVTGKFDLKQITDAIDKVSSSRSSLGAATNALEYTMAQNNLTAENLTASRSRIEDLDMFKAISEQKKNEVIDTYQIMMQKKQQEDEQQKAAGIFNF